MDVFPPPRQRSFIAFPHKNPLVPALIRFLDLIENKSSLTMRLVEGSSPRFCFPDHGFDFKDSLVL